MPQWWPWGRSKRSVPELTAPATRPEPAAPTTRPEPAWHRLPAIQRTVGDIEPTTHLQGFTATLTTSQNPGFTRPLQLLAAEHSDPLPVLDVVRDSARVTAQPVSARSAPTKQPQTWAPRVPTAQRAHLGSGPTIQRTADVTLPEIHTARSAGPAEARPRSMVEAHQPDDRRILEVATGQEFQADEPQSVSRVAPELASIDDPSSTVTEDRVSQAGQPTPSSASASPAVQRLSSSPDGVPAAPQAVSAYSLRSADTGLTLQPRRLPSVQRAATESDAVSRWFAASVRPIPMLRTIDSPASLPPPPKPDTVTPKMAGNSDASAQRSVDPGPICVATADAAASPPPDAVPPSTRSDPDGELPVVRTAGTRQSMAAQPAVTAQRITADIEERDPAPQAEQRPVPDIVAQSRVGATGQSRPAIEVQRLPVVDPRPAPTVAGAESERRTSTMRAVQRDSSVVSANLLPERSAHVVPAAHVEADETPTRSDSWAHLQLAGESEGTRQPTPAGQSDGTWASTAEGRSPAGDATPRSWSQATRMLPTVPHAAGHTTPTTPQSAVAQRSALPVVEPTSALHRTVPPAIPYHSDSTVSPVVQRAAAAGRKLVVLPPVRPIVTNAHDGPDSSQCAPERSVLFESPRPVGLQRMFGDNGMRIDRGVGFRPASSGSAGFDSAAFSPGESSSGPAVGIPQFETSGPTYDPSTNTITFASPTVQRQAEAAPPSESAPAQAPSIPSAPAPSGPATTSPAGDVEELVNKLYDPLAARLRAELWLDRERAGVLMDLGR